MFCIVFALSRETKDFGDTDKSLVFREISQRNGGFTFDKERMVYKGMYVFDAICVK
ncbi:hypothetical protein WH47_10362 [Habropoda laboriosa]|uniref:Uncharacterized protein n=1 Tax=Habropoda laboriosa TaxID=597456 RepID=A0A0L7R9P2_9HYME|nr:hypothetical protein WH47_10362 [Habropoda laboriosa]